VPGDYATDRVEARVQILGRAALPMPAAVAWPELRLGSKTVNGSQWKAWRNSLDVRKAACFLNGRRRRTFEAMFPGVLERTAAFRLIDAEVSVRGAAARCSTSAATDSASLWHVPGLDFVTTERPAADPFSLPTHSLVGLLQFRRRTSSTTGCMCRAVVTLSAGRILFFKTTTLVCASNPANQCGESGRPCGRGGIPDLGGFSPILTEGVFAGSAPDPLQTGDGDGRSRRKARIGTKRSSMRVRVRIPRALLDAVWTARENNWYCRTPAQIFPPYPRIRSGIIASLQRAACWN